MTQTTLIHFSEPPITDHKKAIQRQTILDMLLQKPCSCLDFMKKGIAQYNARILELRRRGHNIVYKVKYKIFRIE